MTDFKIDVRLPQRRESYPSSSSDSKTHCWQIWVTEDKELCWSVVLSLFMRFCLLEASAELKDVVRKVAKKTALSENALQAIEDNIKWYNPFYNRKSIFYKKELQELINALHQRITKSEAKGNDCLTSGSFDRITTTSMITQVSKLLRCQVTVLREFSSKEKLVLPGNNISEYKVLLYAREEGESFHTISFSLPEHVGSKLQEKAIEKIFRISGIEKSLKKQNVDINAKDLLNLRGARENFILAALGVYTFCPPTKSDQTDTSVPSTSVVNKKPEDWELMNLLQLILDQSRYIRDKFCEAGLPILPLQEYEDGSFQCTNDKEKRRFTPTSFYFVFTPKKQKFELLNSLYKCAVNFWLNSEAGIRDVDQQIRSNLENVTVVLKNMNYVFKKENLPSITSDDIDRVDDLIKFNEFQREMCEKLLLKSSKQLQAEQLKELLIGIFSTYIDHYFLKELTPIQDIDFLSNFYEHFLPRSNLLRNLDNIATLLFFDSSFALKNKLKLEGHDEMDSDILRSIFLRTRYSNLADCRSTEVDSANDILLKNQKSLNSFCLVAYLERFDFYNSLVNFRDRVSSADTKRNSREHVPRDEVINLSTAVEIKEEFLIQRLKHYMTVLEADCEKKGKDNQSKMFKKNESSLDQSILIIIRVLQVLGESIKLEKNDTPSVTRSLIASCLPTSCSETIRRIRNKLKSSEVRHVRGRMAIKREHGKKLADIKKDLKKIHEEMEHIFRLQKLRTVKYVNEKAEAKVKNWLEKLPASEEKAEELEGSLQNFQTNVETINKNIRDHVLKLIPRYNKHFENHYSRISDLRGRIESTRDTKTLGQIDATFSAIRVLLKFFIKVFFDGKANETNFNSDLNEIEERPEWVDINLEFEIDFQLTKYQDLQKKLFKCLKLRGYRDGKCETKILCEHVSSFERTIFGFLPLSRDKMLKIWSRVTSSKKYERHSQARTELIAHTEGSSTQKKSSSDIKHLYSNLMFVRKNEIRKAIREKRLELLKNDSRDYYNRLWNAMKKNELKDDDYDFIKENFDLSPEDLRDLTGITSSKSPPLNDELLSLFTDRVSLIDELLLKYSPEFRKSWKEITSSKTQSYMRHKLVSYYLFKPGLQAAIEILVFDCMNLMKASMPHLEHLWHKAEYLFNGMNLCNFLAHGNQLFEAISQLLDRFDLPNDIVTKVVDLVKDLEAVESLHELYGKKIGSSASEIKSFIETCPEGDKCYDLCVKVKKCSRWKNYICLLP